MAQTPDICYRVEGKRGLCPVTVLPPFQKESLQTLMDFMSGLVTVLEFRGKEKKMCLRRRKGPAEEDNGWWPSLLHWFLLRFPA